MPNDREDLSVELIQAQLLLCDLPEQHGELMLEISRRHNNVGVSDGFFGSEDLTGKAYREAIVQPPSPAEREAEIRRMLERLEKLG
jgi:hypothetical protein